jgi:16S rRNA (cytidine1402-2'-O)-methyltransferase
MIDAPADRDLAPGLYLVATPIGNLDDITLRALAVLRGVDLTLAEDTRRTRKLLTHFDIAGSLQSLHEHNEAARIPALIERLADGERMALVSDAGTPLISDPGYALVRAALDAGIPVVPIPGASSLLAALTASGLPPDRFTFVGFLPRKRGARERLFEELADDPGTLIFLESPHRVARSLADAARVLGDRRVTLARELTKVHEQFIRGTLPGVAARLADGQVRGEVVVCVAGRGASAADRDDGPEARRARVEALDRDVLQQRFDELLAAGTPRNDALRQIAHENGVARRDVYKLLMIET